mmetsp:Transcript_120524/g.209821  ORF Transcript_120524/g.209821 Transcript_120524/m.209821 type:complete len:466 (-) Transcript_120524:274-1671(-)
MSMLLIRERVEYTSGVHSWKVKIHKLCSMTSVGICPVGNPTGWWYCSAGYTIDNTGSESVYGPKVDKIQVNDIIHVKLDVDNHTLCFGKNDGQMVTVFTNLPNSAFSPTAKISGFNIKRKDVQFIHEDGVANGSSENEDDNVEVIQDIQEESQDSTGSGKNESVDPQWAPTPEAPSEKSGKSKRDKHSRKHDHDHDLKDDGGRSKPAWVNVAGRLLNGSRGGSSSLCKGHGPSFKTKKGSCSRCECLPCPECVHAFQNIRDTLLSMLSKYHSDVDNSTLMNYSLMFTGLKKNGDVKVDVNQRCCSKHKQRFISSFTINTCCRKHKVETCERIVQTLKENARTRSTGEARHSPSTRGDDFSHDVDEVETDEMDDEDDEEEETDEDDHHHHHHHHDHDHEDLEDDNSTRSKHTSDGSHKGDDTGEEDDGPGQGPRTSKPSGAGGSRNSQKSKAKNKKGGKGRKKGRR